MRAIWFEKAGEPLELIEMDVPKAGPGELVIKVARCGICGSDVHLTQEHGYYPEQSVLGHEFSGEVVEVGHGVENFRIGDRITAMPSAGCGRCAPCLHGAFLLCEQGIKGYAGGFADYMKVSASTAVHLPQTLSLADASLVEPLAVGLHGVALAKVEPGQPVLVLGAGAISLAAIYWARRLGAGKIVAMSRSRRREEMALRMGATDFVQSGENEIAEVQAALGCAPEVVFEGIGVPGALQQCVNHVRANGKIVSLGFCTAPDAVLPSFTTFKQANILFSMAYTLREFEYCAHFLDSGHVDPAEMVSRQIGLAEVPGVIAHLQKSGGTDIKIQVDPAL